MRTNDVIDRARSKVIEAVSHNMNLYGITPSASRLYSLLAFTEKPLTLDEMKDELGMSKTSMSIAVRTLLDLNMVEKVWRKGVRKDLYVINDEPYQRFFDYFLFKWRPAINMNAKATKQAITELQALCDNPDTSNEDRQKAQTDLTKLRNWLHYYDWIDRLIDSFETKEILDFIPLHEELDEEAVQDGVGTDNLNNE
ncbi:HTH-type transcriptional repressor OpcR [Paraliobacillus ryukyuensis]|uniref:HTH-type transcriptional regulator n=1 Tax=Paraliobacillus ryukyuensis TaxID=200904 RepID=A0A366EEM4_9BACI|nr:GbsR/MarR family transcriptional regulator [Paraliobacillus ryukyuensis]RBO99868.1 transcriptional regulator [Paraliobacillus ryukyuensis]